MDERFVRTPRAPYYAVAFTSLRKGDEHDGKGAATERMLDLATASPGLTLRE